MSEMLPERALHVLALLVREYIERGEPVSSLWLARQSGLGVSSATVRNILAQLEALGYVYQPHTSSGRVPTDRGYRGYVNRLLDSRRSPKPSAHVEARLRQASSVGELLDHVSRELFRASHHVSFALAPTTDEWTFQHIDFVPLDTSRMLVVVIATGGQVSHKAIDLAEPLRPVDIQQAANYLNTEFAGMPLSEVREAVLERLRQDRALYDELMARALRLANATFEDLPTQHSIFIQGASSLLDGLAAEDAGAALATLRALFKMIEDKHRLVRILNEYIDGPGLTVVIGAEHSLPDLRHFSLIGSTYRDGKRTGTVGVIGPTRMRYSRAIAAVDGVSRAVTRVLAPGS